MLDPVRAKLRILGLTTVTLFAGVLLASAMQWPASSRASTILQQPPSRSDTRPMAELSGAFVAISDAVTPAVVSIQTQRTLRIPENHPRELPERLRDLFQLPPEGGEIPQSGGGTGFLITPDGYVMTNNHVVEGAELITVTLNDRTVHQARVVGRDPTTDVAVIKLEGNNFPVVRFGDPHETRVGEWVLAIGNPLGLDFTVTAGIVSAKGRPLEILRAHIGDVEQRGYAVEAFIQTDAAINPGNSGGPLVNIDGEVVGINSAIASQTGFSEGYGFAVPIDIARRVAEDLIRYGAVRRPILGVRIGDVDATDAEYLGLPSVGGVMVQGFSMANSPAEQAGLREDDVIIAVDGDPVTQVNELQSTILARRPGEEVELEVIRAGERERLRLRLIEASATQPISRAPANPGPSPSGGTVLERLGLAVAPSSEQLARETCPMALQEPDRGLLVTESRRGSPADNKEVRGCHRIVAVDGQTVTTAEELNAILERKQRGSVVGLRLLLPDLSRQLVTFRVP